MLVLGAGFSKALSPVMPLTDELGTEVCGRVQARGPFDVPDHFTGGEFETWLSRIAEDQPDLTNVDNLVNRSLFQLVSEVLAKVLQQRVRETTSTVQSPPWLRTLLGTLHAPRDSHHVQPGHVDRVGGGGRCLALLGSAAVEARPTSADDRGCRHSQPSAPSTRHPLGGFAATNVPPPETSRVDQLVLASRRFQRCNHGKLAPAGHGATR